MTLDAIITKYERKAAEIPHLAAPDATDLDTPILAALLRELKAAREEVAGSRAAIERHGDGSESIMIPASCATSNGGIGSVRIRKMLAARDAYDAARAASNKIMEDAR